MNWIRKRDGELILDGTPFRISYDASQDFPFRLHTLHEKQARGYMSLAGAKADAETKAAELIEIGLVSLEGKP